MTFNTLFTVNKKNLNLKLIIQFFIVIVLSFQSLVFAEGDDLKQQSENDQYSNVRELYFKAIKYSPDLTISQTNVKISKLQQQKAYSELFIKIDADLTVQRAFNEDSKDLLNQNVAAITLKQPLLNLEANNKIKQFKVKSTLSSEDLNIKRNQFIIYIAEKWTTSLIAEAALKLSSIEIKSYKKLRDKAQQSLDLGAGKKIDVAQTSAAYRLALANQIQRENDLQISKQKLTNLTGITITHLPQWTHAEQKINLIELKQEANNLAENNLINKQKKTIEYNKLEVNSLKSRYYPTLSLQASYSNIHYVESDTSNSPLLVSLNAQWNIFNSFGSSLDLDIANAQLASAKENLRYLVLNEKASLLNTWSKLLAASKRIPAIEAQLQASKVALTAYRQGYDIGTENLPNLLEAEHTYQGAQLNLLKTTYTYWLNFLHFKYITGKLSFNDLPNN